METITTQAVTFDIGGTLIEPWPSVGAVYAEVASEHGFPGLSVDLINQQFQQSWNAKSDFQYTEAGWEDLVRQTFQSLIAETEVKKLFPALYKRFESASVWRIHEDVIPTLDELAGRGFRLAVISNWDPRLRPLLANLKLLSFFEVLTISSEVGFAKPSSVPFEQTLKSLGLPATSVVHVGDSPTEDIDGAESAGVTGILIRRNQPTGNSSIQSLTELSTLLSEGW